LSSTLNPSAAPAPSPKTSPASTLPLNNPLRLANQKSTRSNAPLGKSCTETSRKPASRAPRVNAALVKPWVGMCGREAVRMAVWLFVYSWVGGRGWRVEW
jgi:hypothetical protein